MFVRCFDLQTSSQQMNITHINK